VKVQRQKVFLSGAIWNHLAAESFLSLKVANEIANRVEFTHHDLEGNLIEYVHKAFPEISPSQGRLAVRAKRHSYTMNPTLSDRRYGQTLGAV
jgi:hypothetical protein